MKNRRLLAVALVGALAFPVAALGVATIATRSSGTFYRPVSSNPLPLWPSTAPVPGFYSQNGVLMTCSGSADAGAAAAAGGCYPEASPFPRVGGSADAGSSLGAGAAAKIDTCSTGGIGTTCFSLEDLVHALKFSGTLAP